MQVIISTSASKKQLTNFAAAFNLKTPVANSVFSRLETSSKSKQLNTPSIDALLDWLKSAKQDEVEKFASTKQAENIKKVLTALAKAKTFEGVMSNLGALKFKAPGVVGDKGSTGKKDDKQFYVVAPVSGADLGFAFPPKDYYGKFNLTLVGFSPEVDEDDEDSTRNFVFVGSKSDAKAFGDHVEASGVYVVRQPKPYNGLPPGFMPINQAEAFAKNKLKLIGSH